MLTWVANNALTLLIITWVVGAATPAVANTLIPVFRKRGWNKSAEFLAQFAPLILKSVKFTEDVIERSTHLKLDIQTVSLKPDKNEEPPKPKELPPPDESA